MHAWCKRRASQLCGYLGTKQLSAKQKQFCKAYFMDSCPLSSGSFIFFPSTLISQPKIRLTFYKELSAEGQSVPLM